MLVSFLICGLHGRPWKELADSIQKQIDAAGVSCEVLTNVDGGEKSSGRKRNELTSAAAGEYIAFIDDDDAVSDDYVLKIVSAINDYRPDVVSFWMKVKISRTKVSRRPGRRTSAIRNTQEKWRSGRRTSAIRNTQENWRSGRRTSAIRNTQENWRLGVWPDDRKRGMMAANHLCCWKKQIAIQVPWCEHLGYGDDQLWYGPLHAAFSVKSFHEIKSYLYFYECNLENSKNQTQSRMHRAKKYFGSGLRCFNIDGKIAIEDGHQEADVVKCFSFDDPEVLVNIEKVHPFYIARVM